MTAQQENDLLRTRLRIVHPEEVRRRANPLRFAVWAESLDLKLTSGGFHPARLIGRRPSQSQWIGLFNTHCDWMDHPKLWIRQGRPVCFMSEPYRHCDYSMGADATKPIVKVATEYGLDLVIRPPSEGLHFPGQTWRIELWRPDEWKDVEVLPEYAARRVTPRLRTGTA